MMTFQKESISKAKITALLRYPSTYSWLEQKFFTSLSFQISPNHPKRDHYKYNNELSPLKQASVVVLDRPVYKTAKVVIKAKK